MSNCAVHFAKSSVFPQIPPGQSGFVQLGPDGSADTGIVINQPMIVNIAINNGFTKCFIGLMHI
jgi:hypothetical protein